MSRLSSLPNNPFSSSHTLSHLHYLTFPLPSQRNAPGLTEAGETGRKGLRAEARCGQRAERKVRGKGASRPRDSSTLQCPLSLSLTIYHHLSTILSEQLTTVSKLDESCSNLGCVEGESSTERGRRCLTASSSHLSILNTPFSPRISVPLSLSP